MSIWSRLRGVEKLLSEINRGYVHNDYCKQTCSSVLLTCESCGCAVVKGEEVRGAAELRQPKLNPHEYWARAWALMDPLLYTANYENQPEPFVHTPVYCKRCAGEKAKPKPKRSHHKK